MSVVYCKGKAEDRAEILDFSNLVFSMDHGPTNFKELVPKIYSDRYDTTDSHFICKDNDKIKALILLDKVDLKVGRHTIKVGSVGTVSVHPYERGKGYMKKLMSEVVQEIEANCDLGELDGLRQRYGYFGFETAGNDVVFAVTTTNIRHIIKTFGDYSLNVKKVMASDDKTIASIRNIIADEDLFCTREGDNRRFYDIMSSWKGEVYALYSNDEFKGYFYRIGSLIAEMVVTEAGLIAPFIKEYLFVTKQKDTEIKLKPTQRDLISALAKFSESFYIKDNHSYMPVNIKKLITAFLELKASYSSLEDGEITIKIGEEKLDISLNNNVVDVNTSNKNCMISLTKSEAMTELFSSKSNVGGKLDNLPSFAKCWFPLPLHISSVDVC